MKRNLTVVAVVLLMLVVAAAGCVAKLKEADVRYAGPMVDNLLAGIAAGDYDVFSRDLDETMLKAIDEKAFTTMVDQIRGVIGDYQSKTCLLYTSDAADDLLCVDLGGRRIIKNNQTIYGVHYTYLAWHSLVSHATQNADSTHTT